MSKTVLIQCILIREGGTKVSIDETDYHFMDDGDGNHVAPVTIQKHIDRFMDIPEGYRLFKGASGQASEPVSMGANVVDPTDWDTIMTQHNTPEPAVGLRTPVAVEPITTAAVEPAPAEPAAVDPITSDAPITPEPAAVEPEPDLEHAVLEPQDPLVAGEVVALKDMNDAQLRTVYEDEVGRKPHPAAKADTMRGSIQATRDEKTEAA
jgi:hypothetical protein